MSLCTTLEPLKWKLVASSMGLFSTFLALKSYKNADHASVLWMTVACACAHANTRLCVSAQQLCPGGGAGATGAANLTAAAAPAAEQV